MKNKNLTCSFMPAYQPRQFKDKKNAAKKITGLAAAFINGIYGSRNFPRF